MLILEIIKLIESLVSSSKIVKGKYAERIKII